MEFWSNTGMSFRTKLPSNSPRAGIRCSASRSRSKHERNVTQQPISLHSQGFYGQSLPAINLGISSSWSADVVPQSSQHLRYRSHSYMALGTTAFRLAIVHILRCGDHRLSKE